MSFKTRNPFSKTTKKLSSMTNETVQNLNTQETHQDEEGWENIPPGDSAKAKTSKPEVPVGDGVESSSTQPCGENQHLSDICTFSTPAPTSTKGGVKAKSRLSGLPSALTPILKYLNIGNKSQSPDFIKPSTTNSKISNKGSNQHPSSDSSSSHPGRSLGDSTPMCWLKDEYLPEITLLDVTCDSTREVSKNDSALSDRVPATPVTTRPVCSSSTNLQPLKFNASSSFNTTTPITNMNMDDPPESAFAPLRWLDDRYFPEITLLDVTRDSELSPGAEKSSMNITQDMPPGDAPKTDMASSELSGQPVAEPGTMDNIQTEELSTTLEGNTTHTSSFSPQSKCVEQNITKASLELTQDISVSNLSQNSQSSLEPSGKNIGNTHTIAEDTLETNPANVTRDMNSSSDTSARSATSDMQCDTSSKTITSEVLSDPMVVSNTEESHTSHDSKCSSQSPKEAWPLNDTFTVAKPANLSSSSNLSSTSQTPYNKTLDLPPSNVNIPKEQSEAQDLAMSVSGNTNEENLEMTSSAVKAGGLCNVQNATFDRDSLQKSSSNSTLGEAVAATFCLQNHTFDTRPLPQQNGTITLSETGSTDSHHNTVDLSASSKVCDTTRSPKHTTSEVLLSEESKPTGLTASTDHSAKMADIPEGTFEADPTVEKASGTGQCETKDSSQSGVPMDMDTDGLSDTSVHQCRDLETNKASPFNLDDTLDLAADSLITSTPMPNCKMFNLCTERDTGKIFGATKKLYGETPCKPGGQVTSEIPSNIIGDRKTFLSKPAAKSLLPSSKSASHLLKYKPASTAPGKFEPPTSGLPMTRQRTQTEALRFTATAEAPIVPAGTSSTYNLQATTTEIPSNVICDRKTFLTKPAARSLLPSSKSALHLLKYKPASTVPGKFEPPTSGLPMTRQRTQTEALRCTATSDAPKVPAGISSSYNLRTTTTESKQPNTGLRKPQSGGLPSGIQRSTVGLRPPSAKSNTQAPSTSPDKPRAQTASNLVTKISQAKKHPLSRAEALQVVAKRRKMDAPLPSSNAEASTSSCDAANRAKNPKQPTTNQRAVPAKTHNEGCANCFALEQQLKMKSEEIRRLKEELQKFCKEEEC
ncbi:mucin-17-like [Notolabrus celidotus]|uniref:mucin-17-like n=1 Tax=Notolabrus celidotus TaxID=1203425 RepID=UPI0014903E02|nr:mucin-17-like [Notolabrus celidotus]